VAAQPIYGVLSQRGLLDPTNPTYNQSRLDGQLKLTASTFNQLWISVLAILVTVPTVVQKARVRKPTLFGACPSQDKLEGLWQKGHLA